jgi:acyl-CoA reductase-like NAD-dependent aldehyde dehydrogenase
VYVERTLAVPAQIEAALESARLAERLWRGVSLPARARHMIAIAPEALADIDVGAKGGFHRFLRREPLGVAFKVAAWNYPHPTAVNSVVPALMAGSVVLLKHSAQTPLCAERFEECLRGAGLPVGVFQALHLSHADTERVIRDPRVDFVAFTGSVAGGHAVQRAASDRSIGTGLELGGSEPAYLRHDADRAHAIENLVDGWVEVTRKYVLGNPLDPNTTFGPALAWVGVKDSGRGCTLSAIGYEHLTSPKSLHLEWNSAASLHQPPGSLAPRWASSRGFNAPGVDVTTQLRGPPP